MRTLIALYTLAALVPAVQAQPWAKEKLEKSPRHQEWVDVKHGDRTVKSFIVFPEVKDKATSVVLIHEIFGLSDWVRSVADQLAEAGFIAIAPDLLTGQGPKGGGTEELGRPDVVRRFIGNLPPDQITADLNACVDYCAKLPAANGKVVVGGFCWGGGQSFRFATNNKSIKAALVFYGTGPESEAEIAKITCPVYGFYGGNDARVTSTVAKSAELMKKENKTYEPVTYDGAGHGFMRAGEEPNAKPADKKARDEAWVRWKEIMKKVS